MQFTQLKRREFITLLGGAAVGWPPAARGQTADRVRRIGWLHFFPESDPGLQVHAAAFRQGMEKLGWSVGRNLSIDYRWGAFNVERARVIAAELLNLAPDVIVSGGTPGALAFQQITRTVPIVFAVVTEPVPQGIVQSLAHPGGNATGFTSLRRMVRLRELESHGNNSSRYGESRRQQAVHQEGLGRSNTTSASALARRCWTT